MPEFKVVGGTVSDVIHFFEQQLHITFPVQPPSGGSGGKPAGQDAGQDLAHTIQEHLPQGAASTIQEHVPQGGSDGNAFGSFGPNIAQPIIEAMNDPHRVHDAFSDWFRAVGQGSHWSDIA